MMNNVHVMTHSVLQFHQISTSHTHTFINPYCFWANPLTSSGCVLQAASLPERGRGFARRLLRRHFGWSFSRDGQSAVWLRHRGVLSRGAHSVQRGFESSNMCVCLCVCKREIHALQMLQCGNWLLPTPPSAHSHTSTRCPRAVTPHGFHGNLRARWNMTWESK